MVFTKFVQWDKFAQRFGYVTVSREALASILELVDEKKLEEKARIIGAKVPREASMFWFKKTNVETFLSYLQNTCKYGGQAECEHQVSAGDYTIALRHELGPKWSQWLRFMIDEALRNLFGIVAQFETTDSEVIVRFYAPPLVRENET
jgi:hypothetical protein